MPEIVTSSVLLTLVGLLGYLLGSVPFGIVITRALGLGDLRAIGSGNIGATNVLRTGHKGAALATLLLDAGKGAVAVLIARFAVGEDAAQVAGGMAFLGHLFPVWLGFRGGQGGGDVPRHALGAGLAGGAGGLRDVGGGGGCDTDFVGLGADRSGPFRAVVRGVRPGRCAVADLRADGAGLYQALAQPAAHQGRDRTEDREKGLIRDAS